MKLSGTKANILLLIASILLTLAVAEGYFRYRAQKADRALYGMKRIAEQVMHSGGYAPNTQAYGFMIKLTDNDRIVFELKPHLHWEYRDVYVDTNMSGFRDKHYLFAKPPGTVRIVGIGDSVMFGQGAPQETDYLAVLETKLNELFPTRRWEVINTGVPEYNTPIEVETLRAKGLKYSPDLVVIGAVSNDYDIPEFVQLMGLPEKLDVWDRYVFNSQSFLSSYVRARLDKSPDDVPLMPNKYASLAGERAAMGALEDLKRMSVEHGFPVVMLFLEPEESSLAKAFMAKGRELGFHIVHMAPVLKEYMARKGIKDYYAAGEMVVTDKHPTMLTHALTAETLLRSLSTEGLIQQLMAGTPERATTQ
jgi:hypothetical protein